jgi:TRAP transporter TAXI family solute receptor
VVGALAATALATIAPAVAEAQTRPEVTVSLLGAPFGTGTYVLSSALEQIARKEHPWLRISASESPGYVFNMKKLDAEPELKKNTIVGSGPALGRLAADGAKPFDKKLPAQKVLANFVITAVWLATTSDKIKSKDDVPGKRIAFGQAAQINWAVLPRAVLEHGWGITPSKVTLQYFSPASSIAAMLDGKVDLVIIGGYVDPATHRIALSPPTTELIAANRPLTHLSWGKDAVERTEPKGFSIVPYTVAAKSVDGKNPPIETFIDSGAWTVAPEFPEEIAYEVTKLVIQHIGKFGEVHAIGKLMSREGLVYGWKPENFHPGALRAYKEAGILK